MSDALPLLPRPKLDLYERLVERLQAACQSGDLEDIRKWATHWIKTVANKRGLDLSTQQKAQMGWQVGWIVRDWQKHQINHPRPCSLSGARFFVAHAHEFAGWSKFVKYLDELKRPTSLTSKFEQAVDAIVSGDLATLDRLLKKYPQLIRARSHRKHRSTLLHYVSANGVEDFRQKTPENIVEITRRLLLAGADVNAESDAYGGRSTTFGLAATSCHPEEAGVQLPLLGVLMDYGSIIDGPDGGSEVNGALANGRGDAAQFLANRGAKLDLEGAAGVGRLDVVKTFFTNNGRLKSSSTRQQMVDGFAWACEFGHKDVVDFLLSRGMSVEVKVKHHGQTGLHWAAYGGHLPLVKLLLDHGASVHVKDPNFDGNPLQWALYAWRQLKGKKREPYYAIVSTLVRAGAKLEAESYAAHEEGRRALKKFRADSRMVAALGPKSL
jgi:ankyrin repeat protein